MKKFILSLLILSVSATSIFAMNFNEAKTKGKPVVIMFHQNGCSACRKISPEFDKLSGKYSNKFNFVKEDVASSDIGRTLNFQTVPAFFIVEPKSMKAVKITDNCAWDEACFAKTLENYQTK